MKSLRLLRDVRGDFPIGHMTVAKAGVYSGDQIHAHAGNSAAHGWNETGGVRWAERWMSWMRFAFRARKTPTRTIRWTMTITNASNPSGDAAITVTTHGAMRSAVGAVRSLGQSKIVQRLKWRERWDIDENGAPVHQG